MEKGGLGFEGGGGVIAVVGDSSHIDGNCEEVFWFYAGYALRSWVA